MASSATGSRTVLRWLFLIQLVSMGAMEMSAPFWPLHLRALGGLSPQALAWASAMAYAGPLAMAMCFTPWWGRLGDRTGHKPMLLRALLALAVTQLWIGMADDIVTLLAVRLVQGALAGFIAAAQAYGAGLVVGDKRGSLMARLQVATAVGSMAGPLAGGWLFDTLGFRFVNIVAAAVCLACAITAWLALPATAPLSRAHSSSTEPKKPFALGAVYGLLLGIALVQTGKMMPQAFFGLFVEQVLHTPGWVTGLCYGATAFGLCIAAPFWGRRFDGQPSATVLSQVQWVCWACAAIALVQATSHNLYLFILARVLWGVCLAALLPVFYGLLSRQADGQQQGRVLGAGNSAAKAGALLGAGGGGLILAWIPIQYAFWPVALVYAIAAIGLRFIRTEESAATRAQRGASAINPG
ncbi:MFS transporter [Polaromonas sp.]|uniref:MFS transporter n=1 Tax=Polaromonas sp. TaxID=1869339 RepID=UPI0017F56D0D|nr:MFS transporter [Polaromonas sp.]NMM08441.1 multidrug efflux MFS transporter [Polaromonas sp.]